MHSATTEILRVVLDHGEIPYDLVREGWPLQSRSSRMYFSSHGSPTAFPAPRVLPEDDLHAAAHDTAAEQCSLFHVLYPPMIDKADGRPPAGMVDNCRSAGEAPPAGSRPAARRLRSRSASSEMPLSPAMSEIVTIPTPFVGVRLMMVR
jgi:hypothetical protein